MQPIRKFNEGAIILTKSYKSGDMDTRTKSSLGSSVGRYHYINKDDKDIRGHLLLAGPIDIGLTMHDLIFVQHKRYIFLGREGKVWKLNGVLLPIKCPSIRNLSKEGVAIWADTMSQFVIDRLTPNKIVEPLKNAKVRYRRIIRELAEVRVLDAAAQGRERTIKDFATGVCPDWGVADLVSTRHPDVRHSLLAMLVLGVEANKAADVIELAAFIEHKLPLFNRQSCLAIYHSAVETLSRLCPTWWSQSYLTNWKTVGSIERLFTAQFCRIMNDSYHREIPEEFVAGVMASSEKYTAPENDLMSHDNAAYFPDRSDIKPKKFD